MTEKQIEKKLIAEIRKRGGLCMKFVSPGNAGVPDRIVIHNGRVWFVEVKTATGVLSAMQHGQIARIRATGAEVRVLREVWGVKWFMGEVARESEVMPDDF